MGDERNASSMDPALLNSINNTPDPSIKLPPIVLSGALHGNGGLEFDPQGVPYFRFPPFATTTIATRSAPAAPLVPFSAFKPNGIQIMLNPDEDEVDSIGIRTVHLGVSHLPGGKDSKKKRKNRKKLDVTFERKVMWWEDWEEGESLRKSEPLDANNPRLDRFMAGAADFQRNRRWTPTLQSVYDNFTQFVGISGKTFQHIGKGFGSAKKQAQPVEEDMDVEADDEAEFADAVRTNDSADPSAFAVAPTYNPDEARIQELTAEYEEARELKLQAFLDDPELHTKIFFSSFYKNKGLFWSESKLRDGPLLIRFFFNFFKRNGLLRDHDREFNKALAVVERAVVELPLTTKISKEIPDEFGNACVGVWEKQITEINDRERKKVLEEYNANKKDSGPSNPDPSPPDPTSKPDTNNWGDPFSTLSQDAPDPSSWKPFEIPSQWDPSDATLNSNQPESNPWDPIDTTADWSLPSPPFLMSLIGGPVSLPVTHEVKFVEKSTRRIVSVEDVNEGEKNRSALGKFAKVFLEPWYSTRNPPPKASSNSQEVLGESILPPELYVINPPSSSSSLQGDVTNQTIAVHISPSNCALLRRGIGMGVYAVFVKVGPREDGKKESERERQPQKKRPKSKSTLSKSDSDSEFWYIELLYEVTPSFWTESDEGLEERSED